MEEHISDNKGADIYIGNIIKVLNCSCDREGGGVIPYPLFPSMALENCKDENETNDRDVYNNNDVRNHDYRVKGGILAGTGVCEG